MLSHTVIVHCASVCARMCRVCMHNNTKNRFNDNILNYHLKWWTYSESATETETGWQMPAKQANRAQELVRSFIRLLVHVYNINASIRYGDTIFESVPPILAFSVIFFYMRAVGVCVTISYFCRFLHIKQSLLRTQSAMWIGENHSLSLSLSLYLFRSFSSVQQSTNVSECSLTTNRIWLFELYSMALEKLFAFSAHTHKSLWSKCKF